MHDLAIIVVSTSEAHWLRPCLTTVYEHAGSIDLEVVVVDNDSSDGTAELVLAEFPHVRLVRSENRGFGHANNAGALTCDARYVLFLNPDTEIVRGTFEELVHVLDTRPDVGLAGVKQQNGDGALHPTIRRSPNALRAFGEALGSERFPFRSAWLGERELDLELYDREVECGWTSGSFMVVRREALISAGLLDERFFIYGEEPDLCNRVRLGGWRVLHLPVMTIVHHAGKGGVSERMESQAAFARLQYARKYFGPLHRTAFMGSVGLRYALRAAMPADSDAARRRRAAARAALRVLTGRDAPPFGVPPNQALRLEADRAGTSRR